MAVPDLDIAAKEAVAPPTPPSDQMDIDPGPNTETRGGTLQNGAPPAPEKTGSEQREDATSRPEAPVPVALSNVDTNAHGIPLPNGAPSAAAETVGAEPPQDPTPSPPSATVALLVINSQVTVNDHDMMDELPNGTALAPEAALPERSLEPTQVQEPDAPVEEQPVSVEQPGATSPPPALPSLASAPVESSVVESQESLNDQDEPMSSGKVAREREDDDMDCGPAAKRSRTDGDISSAPAAPAAPEFKVPDLPELNTNVTEEKAEPVDSKPFIHNDSPITKLQHRFILKVIQNIKRTNDAMPFTKPVDIVALNIPTYPTIVTNPMDLRTMEEKLKNNQYPSIAVYVNDFNQIVENSMSFNGPEHVVTKNALNIRASFEKQMLNLPGPDPPEPPPAEKKKKAPAATTTKATSSRRESRSSLPGSARSPITAASPTFALGPQGVPLIRRDSTVVGDGRPKREIHPPAPRDLPYANQKPKKKKYQLELKFCQHVMNELLKPKHQHIAFPFLLPVDPVALNIPHYHKVIKNPMDLGTVGTKLSRGQYENAKEFEADIRLIFSNCYKFNPDTDPVHAMGNNLEAVFDEKWAEKSRWIEANIPASGRQSPGSSPEPEEEEEEEEEDEDDRGNELAKLQQQIAAMSRQVELITQKKKSPPAAAKKGKGGKTTGKKDGKKNSSAVPAKVEKKATKPAKKEKTPYVTYEQKQDISNRINSLSETRMATALKIIRDNMPNLKGVQDDEIELDIDELSDEVLHKLLVFVRRHAPKPEDSPPRKQAPAAQPVAQPRKKNKPMSKTEQEARIQKVKGNLSAFQQNPGSPDGHGHANTSTQANEGESSGDDPDDSEESEEE